MHKAIRCIVVMLALTAPAAVLAQGDIPDLTGRWTIEAVNMTIKPAQTAPLPGEVSSEFLIDWQEGARFLGREVSQEPNSGNPIVSDDEQFAGIIGTDNTTIYLVDENGLRDCWVRSPDALECVYRHIQADRSVVSWNVWTKQPE